MSNNRKAIEALVNAGVDRAVAILMVGDADKYARKVEKNEKDEMRAEIATFTNKDNADWQMAKRAVESQLRAALESIDETTLLRYYGGLTFKIEATFLPGQDLTISSDPTYLRHPNSKTADATETADSKETAEAS